MRPKVSWCLIKALICVSAILFPVSLVADTATQRYAFVRDSYLSLQRDSERQRFRHNYIGILEGFESFVSDFPEHQSAPAALYNAGRLAWDLYLVSRVGADLRRAREYFLRIAAEYPGSSLADDGLFLAGRTLVEHGGDKKEAYLLFKSIPERFPDGDMVPGARKMIEKLAEYAPTEERPEKTHLDSARRTETKRPAILARTGAWQGSGDDMVEVGNPEINTGDNFVRILFPVSGSLHHRDGELPSDLQRGLPRRIFMDLKPAVFNDGAGEFILPDSFVSRVRIARFSQDIVRVVLDLKTERTIGVYPMFADGSLVLDITDSEAETAGDSPEEIISEKEIRRINERMRVSGDIPLSVQAGLKIRRVVIDPGHGGNDVGAVGPGGLQEKEVTLDIAKKLGNRLSKDGFEVVYTRTEDVFVPLEKRTATANDKNADLFISIHANASTRRERRGVSTYYLDVTSDRYSMRLAARENAGHERTVGELHLILADLTTRHNTDESARLAANIQEKLVERLSMDYEDVRDLGVRYALFFVLLGARMPSVLVETSFISNPAEERLLSDQKYRQHLAEGIYNGIIEFISNRDSLALGE